MMQYDIEKEYWSELPKPPVTSFGMTSFKEQLTLAGCTSYYRSTTVTVWESSSNQWVQPYPPMPTSSVNPTAVSYHKYLIVAGGFCTEDEVKVFDSSTGQWHSPEPLLQEGKIVSSAVVGNYWYLYLSSRLNRNCLVSVHLPTLVSGTNTTMESIWHELPLPKDTSAHGPSSPSTQAHVLISLRGHLLLVEEHQIHHYDSQFKQWSDCGHMPVAMSAPFFAVLPSGLLLAGDWKASSPTRRMLVGHAKQLDDGF